ncbi:MAG: hypothetical protein COB29_15505 [Sulfitobacter sp.]|nr:MAG: hypothetical protein COB29_15505 [Sulfitobacter sp.]
MTGETSEIQQFLDTRQRGLWHTTQELEGIAMATSAALILHPVSAQPNQLRPLLMGTDNKATQKNINKQGAKPSMVNPLIPVALQARTRNMIPVGVRKDKDYMDFQSNCDALGRIQANQHPEEWGLLPRLIQRASKLLQCPVQWTTGFDLFACRQTRQCRRYFPRYHDGIAPRADAMMWDWSMIPQQLYAHPPEALIHRVVQKIRPLQRKVLLMVPLYATKHSWWPEVMEMAVSFLPIPFHKHNLVTPDGSTPDATRHTQSTMILFLLCPNASRERVSKTMKKSRRLYSPTTLEVSRERTNNSKQDGWLLPISPTLQQHLRSTHGLT